MKINGSKTVTESYDVSNEEIIRAFESIITESNPEGRNENTLYSVINKYLHKKFDLHRDVYRSGDNWVMDVDYWGGTHDWTDTKIMRPVSDLEHKILDATTQLFTLLKEMSDE